MGRENSTRTVRQWLGDDGILRAVYRPGVVETLDEARENTRLFATLLPGGQPAPAMVDLRNLKSVSREVRAHYAGPEIMRLISAMAVIIGSPVSRMIGNFFMTLNKPPKPTRLFTDEAEALAWLKSLAK